MYIYFDDKLLKIILVAIEPLCAVHYYKMSIFAVVSQFYILVPYGHYCKAKKNKCVFQVS